MTKQITSVLLADFQFLTRQGISSLIEGLPDFEVTNLIDKPENLEEAIVSDGPDLVVLDISTNDTFLISELERIKKSKTEVSFLVISNNQNRESIQKLLSIGIKGVVTKNCSEEEITSALIAVSRGNRFFCNNVLDLVVDGPAKEDDCEPTNLSPREFEVLKLITKGFTTNQIAETLHLSVHTINSHRKNILKKLNLGSPAELIVFALESGLVKS